MKSNKAKYIFTGFITLLLHTKLVANSPATTHNDSFYIGLGAGTTIGDMQLSTKVDEITEVTAKGETINNKVNIFAGANVLPYLALEIEYNNYLENTILERAVDLKGTYKYSGDVISFNMVFKKHLSQHHIIYGKLGLGSANYSFNERYQEGTSSVTLDGQYFGVSYKIGAGYEAVIDYNNSIMIEYVFNVTPNAFVDAKIYENTTLTWLYSDIDAFKHKHSNINIAYKYSFGTKPNPKQQEPNNQYNYNM